jgi:hypothetical protein
MNVISDDEHRYQADCLGVTGLFYSDQVIIESPNADDLIPFIPAYLCLSVFKKSAEPHNVGRADPTHAVPIVIAARRLL